MKVLWSVLGLLVLSVLTPNIPMAAAEENGIKVGDGVLHPFIDLQSRYDTFATLDGNGNPVGDLLWDIRPGLKLDIPSPTFSVDLGGDLDALLYTFNSGLDRVLADGSIALGINRGGSVGLELGDQFNRSDNNNMVALPFAIISNFNDANAKLEFRPGGGALSIEPGYDFIFENFEPVVGAAGYPGCSSGSPLCDPGSAAEMDSVEHKFSLNARWKFLPKTALLIGGDYLIANYMVPGSGASANAPLDIVDGTVGVAGLLTNRLEVIAKAGYAQTILSAFDLAQVPALSVAGNAHTFVGQLQLAYLLSETGNIKIGIQRLLQPSPTVLSYVTDTRPYIGAKILLFGRLSLHLDASYDIFDYPLDSVDFANTSNPASRTDGYLRLDVGPEVEITRWLRLAAGYDLTDMSSTDVNAYDYRTTSMFGGPGYSNQEVYLRVTLTY